MSEVEDFAALSRLINGYAAAQIVFAAVRLDLPDALATGPLTEAELATAVDCDPDGLSRLLRALIILGLAAEPEPGRFALSPVGAPLCADHPRSVRSAVLLASHPDIWQAWGALSEGVRNGTAAFDQVHGRPLFDHLADHPGLSEVFNAAMSEGTGWWIAPAVARACDVRGARTIVDVGGGSGALLAAVLKRAPEARGILFDTPEGVARADRTLRDAGVSDRCSIHTGDFFQQVPDGDVMLLKGILHDWDDERCGTVLRHCRAAIADDGRLFVVEPVMPERLDAAEAAGAVMSDIAMLVYTGGRERTGEEFRKLLSGCGFELSAISGPLAGSSVRALSAVPV